MVFSDEPPHYSQILALFRAFTSATVCLQKLPVLPYDLVQIRGIDSALRSCRAHEEAADPLAGAHVQTRTSARCAERQAGAETQASRSTRTTSSSVPSDSTRRVFVRDERFVRAISSRRRFGSSSASTHAVPVRQRRPIFGRVRDEPAEDLEAQGHTGRP